MQNDADLPGASGAEHFETSSASSKGKRTEPSDIASLGHSDSSRLIVLAARGWRSISSPKAPEERAAGAAALRLHFGSWQAKRSQGGQRGQVILIEFRTETSGLFENLRRSFFHDRFIFVCVCVCVSMRLRKLLST